MHDGMHGVARARPDLARPQGGLHRLSLCMHGKRMAASTNTKPTLQAFRACLGIIVESWRAAASGAEQHQAAGSAPWRHLPGHSQDAPGLGCQSVACTPVLTA